MEVLKTELDGYTLETIDFMEKVDESFRKRIHRYARLLYSEYQEELEQSQKKINIYKSLKQEAWYENQHYFRFKRACNFS